MKQITIYLICIFSISLSTFSQTKKATVTPKIKLQKSQFTLAELKSLVDLDVSEVSDLLKSKNYVAVNSEKIKDDNRGNGTIYVFANEYDANKNIAIYWVSYYLFENNTVTVKHTFYDMKPYYNSLKSSIKTKSLGSGINGDSKCDNFDYLNCKILFCNKYNLEKNTTYREVQITKSL